MLQNVLATPIAWTTSASNNEVKALLMDLQTNIVKGHGRDHTGHIFISFATMRPSAVASVLRSILPMIPSALDQLQEAETYKATGKGGRRIVSLFLAAGAYRALNVPEDQWPSDAAFRAGMRASQTKLADPPPTAWGQGAWTPGNPPPDAMILVADDSDDHVTAGLQDIQLVLNGTGVRVLGEERGHAFRRRQDPANPKGEGMEHFGYADGRSQPLFLAEDVAAEVKNIWNPAFPPAQFIVSDPAGTPGSACGSYFVFRKLDQNVKGFKDSEEQLADAMGLKGEDRERTGAMVVGRFEDGTPVTLHGAPQGGSPINDFDYKSDADGARCPFRGHTRKTNPRGDIQHQFNAPEAAERAPIMARRGITYGERRQQANGDFAEDDRPTADVGLLFMAYMSDIAAQFEFTQASWVNNRDFVVKGTGVDPVIGQGGTQPPQSGTEVQWKDGYDPAAKTVGFDFQGFVTMLGGEYFFAPSLSGLHRLASCRLQLRRQH